MYNLPFKVNDGKTTRQCTYEDLWLIVEFMLPYKVYSKRRKWWVLPIAIHGDVIPIMYACIKALHDTDNMLPYSYLHTVSFVDRSNIRIVKCKELHKWKNNALAKMMRGLE